MKLLAFTLCIAPAVGFAPGVKLGLPRVPTKSATVRQVAAPLDNILPDNADVTIRNLYGYQALALGAAGLAKPAWTAAKFGVGGMSAYSTMYMRGAALASLLLGGRIVGGSDRDATQDGFLAVGALWWFLRGAQGAAAGHARVWCLLMALFAARENGGLWDTLTSWDTTLLNRVLPADYAASTRNLVGFQMLAGGVALLARPTLVSGALGVVGAAGAKAKGSSVVIAALVTKMLATQNLLLGGRVVGGSDRDAASNGVVFFGGWTVLLTLAARAGTISGKYVLPLQAWNLAMAVYSYKQR